MDNSKAAPELQALVGKQIVVDTDSSYIYIGYLESAGADFLALTKVDVHDVSDSRSTKEHYAHESKRLGSRHNRELTLVRLARVLSVSKLEDVISF
jgi:hypothetical protein